MSIEKKIKEEREKAVQKNFGTTAEERFQHLKKQEVKKQKQKNREDRTAKIEKLLDTNQRKKKFDDLGDDVITS